MRKESIVCELFKLILFQPPPRDAVQQFSEKHFDTIKQFIRNFTTRLPIPVKASLEG